MTPGLLSENTWLLTPSSENPTTVVPSPSSKKKTTTKVSITTILFASAGIFLVVGSLCSMVSNTMTTTTTSLLPDQLLQFLPTTTPTMNNILWGKSRHRHHQHRCTKEFDGVIFVDIHDGDQKNVTIQGNEIIILPTTTEESWIVNSTLDSSTCSAMIDFNVPGKPSPPPVPLLLTIWEMETFVTTTSSSSSEKRRRLKKHHRGHGHDDDEEEQKKQHKLTMEFTDPSGTLVNDTSLPLNHWVELLV